MLPEVVAHYKREQINKFQQKSSSDDNGEVNTDHVFIQFL